MNDEIIVFIEVKAIETIINEHKLRLVSILKEDENKVIHIITTNLDWIAKTLINLYQKRWDIVLFFKSIKQNLHIKTFGGTSENALKLQINVAFITFFLLELLFRTIAKKTKTFSNFVEKKKNLFGFLFK